MSDDGLSGTGTFGHYRLDGLLGRGGMGLVYRAYDTRRQRVVALKLLPEQLSAHDALVERFRREAFAAAGLSDPHVVPIHDFGEIDGRLFIDMQLIAGRNLAEMLVERVRLEPGRAVHILRQAAHALDTAHAANLVHRDVKPSNLLVLERREDFTYLVDFGIAHVVGTGPGASLTATGAAIGTLAYMAPERFTAPHGIDGRVDVYALTCVLFEMLTGRPPFPGEDLPSLLHAHLHTPPPSAGELTTGASTGWDAVIARGMAKDPDQRYRTAAELADAARQVLLDAARPTSVVGVRPDDETRAQPPSRSASGASGRGPTARSGDHGGDGGGDGGDPATVRVARDAGPTVPAPRVSRADPSPPASTPPPGRPPSTPPNPTPIPTPPRPAPQQPAPLHRTPPHPTAIQPVTEVRRRRRAVWWLVPVAVLVALGVTAALVFLPRGGGSAELVLEAAAAPGDGAFTPDFRTSTAALPGSALASSLPAGADREGLIPGSTDGLYRSSRSTGDCDRDGLADYLADRPVVRDAWTAVLAADATARAATPAPTDPGYLDGLTPMLLRTDLRVVDHRYVDGAAEPFTAALQAGTAVLVDSAGLPRVRCVSGSPLVPLGPPGPGAELVGTPWPGFDALALPTLAAADRGIVRFGLAYPNGSEIFRRPIGSTGAEDVEQLPVTATMAGTYALTGQQKSCTLSGCDTFQTIDLGLRLGECVPGRCTVYSDRWAPGVPLVLDGDTWRAAGTVAAESQPTCEDQPVPTDFKLDLRTATGVVADNDWRASELTAFYAENSQPSGPCVDPAEITFDATAVRR